ncbi:group I truncated hemoglobin [Shewanella ulleungensis]|jgi:hemoglobin|uniref:Group 1 truncated hemoglobin n=1 Tax=Shewanella ulleungensis TaxID=2282699 RepID=A0ABQ2QUB9_9GAMM|nr:group 1 truncated hemoglobin [Shewanella ulleungensis]MCL1151234.1 group 1 truncated hemoglobin [Shewanella ulleungensis]GGP96504.1 cyanoglobin [Shewanella ulleungensis]
MLNTKRYFIGLFVGLLLVSSGCANQPTTLYEQLGGNAGISQITDDFLLNLSQDKRIVNHFAHTDIDIFRQRLIEHLCEVSGGGCHYEGASMFDAHIGLHISQADFDAVVGHLISALKQQNVSISARNALLAKLAPMYQDITYH